MSHPLSRNLHIPSAHFLILAEDCDLASNYRTGLCNYEMASSADAYSTQDRRKLTMQSPSGSRPKITVIIPTLNEARNLPCVLPLLPQGLHEVIVVDGHSVDNTVVVARQLRPDVLIITQDHGGKRNALACGSAAATGDIIVMLDADGSVDPAEIPQLVNVLLGGADFVKGTRFASRGITSSGRIANQVLSALVNSLGHTRYSDPCYGFNAFWRRHVPALGLGEESPAKPDGATRLSGDGFEVDTLINIRAARAGLTVKEVASYGYQRTHEISNLDTVNDGLRILLAVLSERYRLRHRRASAIAALMVLLGADLKLASRRPRDGLFLMLWCRPA